MRRLATMLPSIRCCLDDLGLQAPSLQPLHLRRSLGWSGPVDPGGRCILETEIYVIYRQEGPYEKVLNVHLYECITSSRRSQVCNNLSCLSSSSLSVSLSLCLSVCFSLSLFVSVCLCLSLSLCLCVCVSLSHFSFLLTSFLSS